MDVASFLTYLRQAPWHRDQMSHVETIPPRKGRYANPKTVLHPRLQDALEHDGIWPLYLHQAEAIDALARGENVVVATPAASGKSLCYHLPVVDRLLRDRSVRALYVYPTKALAQDQLRALRELTGGLGPFRIGIFDGDTPPEERAVIRRSAQVILTNPDMLHLGILPNHKRWGRLFQALRYVVIDEAHVYRGVFGSHVANLIRRLRRICRLYGSTPQFILASATIGNPGDLAEGLTGLPFTVIDDDGAPYGGKRFVLWNPPLEDESRGVRQSANSEAARLLAELVQKRVRSIVFVRSRRLAELVSLHAQRYVRETAPELADRVRAYRASYLPEQRREIERGLFRGELLGVAATTALELGIDVGDLDATVLAGYPGTVAATYQQAGRSGRRGEESLSVLVALDNPLDQYLMRHPGFLFERPVERALISPENPHVLGPHLLCAAYEAPLSIRDAELFGESMAGQLDLLCQDGSLRRSGDRWHLSPTVTYPAEDVNIRSTSANVYLVVEKESGAVLETVDEASALFQLHPGAVYLHQGEPYLIDHLDLESRVAHASATDVPYYTQPREVTDIRVIQEWKKRRAGDVDVCLGEVEVSTQVVGFLKKRPLSNETVGEETLDLPPQRFDTVALWFGVPQAVVACILRERRDLAGGLHAVEHAAIAILPLFAMCDRDDLGGVSTPLHPDVGKPQVFIYDAHPGGVGIAEEGYRRVEELWRATLRAVEECPCDGGCPGCVQSPKCGNNNYPLDKNVAAEMLCSLVIEQA